MPGQELVSVIIPAFNAAATIDETLSSVRAQTYANLEIIVVDDGSRDHTPEIVARHGRADDRVRLVSQRNGGVARARNRGIAEAAGVLVAPVDADDLWAPTKIAKQVRALQQSENAALTYTWYAVIDERNTVIELHKPAESGDVLSQLCAGNFVGNGSSVVMLKRAVQEAGGYEPALRDRQAQGCEDFLLYLRIAERHAFAVVPEVLTGYRQTTTNMSSNAPQMLRSWHLATQEILSRHLEFAPQVRKGAFWFQWWLLRRSFAGLQPRAAARLLARLIRHHPQDSLRTLLDRRIVWGLPKHEQVAWSHLIAPEERGRETSLNPDRLHAEALAGEAVIS